MMIILETMRQLLMYGVAAGAFFQGAVTRCQRRRGIAGPDRTFPVDAAGSLLLALQDRKKEACTPATSFKRRTLRKTAWQSSKDPMQWLPPPLAATSFHFEPRRLIAARKHLARLGYLFNELGLDVHRLRAVYRGLMG